MPKLGSAYEQLVGAVCSALEPGADVRVNTSRYGPDGRRDMDVSIRGTRDGKPFFGLVECKDWKRRVGVQVIDALHSKRQDLQADASAIYSNSGFTKTAERKATRVGISLCSAMKSGDERVRVTVEQRFIARRLSVNSWSLFLYWQEGLKGPSVITPEHITYRQSPLVNWISEKSRELLLQHSSENFVRAEYVFREKMEFRCGDELVELLGLAINMTCSNDWVYQIVQEDVSLGSYDFLKRQVVVPDQQYWSLGAFDNKAWQPSAPPLSEVPMTPNSFRLGITLLNFIPPIAGASSPDLDPHVKEHSVTLSSSTPVSY